MSQGSQPLSKDLKRKHKRSAPSDTLANHLHRNSELTAITQKFSVHVESQQKYEKNQKPSQTGNKPFLKKNICTCPSKTPDFHIADHKESNRNIVIIYPMKSNNDTADKKIVRQEKGEKVYKEKRSEHNKSLFQDYSLLSAKKYYNTAKTIDQHRRRNSQREPIEDKVTANILKNVSQRKNKANINELKNLVKSMVLDEMSKAHEQFFSQSEDRRSSNHKKGKAKHHNFNCATERNQDFVRISKLASLRSMDSSFYEQNADDPPEKTDSRSGSIFLELLDSELEMDCLQQIKQFQSKDYSQEVVEDSSRQANRKEGRQKSDQVERHMKTQDLIENYLSVLRTEDLMDSHNYSDFIKPTPISKRQNQSHYSQSESSNEERNIEPDEMSIVEDSRDSQNSQGSKTLSDSQLLFAGLAKDVRQKMAVDEQNQNPADILEFIYSRLENEKNREEKPEIKIVDSGRLLSRCKNLSIQIDISSDKAQLPSTRLENPILNDNLQNISFQILDEVLLKRQKRLQRRRHSELFLIEEMHESGRLSYSQFVSEKEKVQRWIKIELKEISKARKKLVKNYNEVASILDRTPMDQQDKTPLTQGIMKCLSQKYLGFIHKSQPSEEGFPIEVPLTCNQYDFDKQLEGSEEEPESIEAIREAFVHMKERISFCNGNQAGNKNNSTPEDSPSQSSDDQSYFEQRKNRKLPEYGSSKLQSSPVASQSDEGRSPIHDLKYKAAVQLKGMEEKVKNEICEFIFLDMCIEIYSEEAVINNPQILAIIRNKIKENEDAPVKKKGMKADMKSIKDFLTDLHQFLSEYHSDELENLAIPMGPTAQEILKFMHQSSEYEETQDNSPAKSIFPNQLFDKFELKYASTVLFSKYYDDWDKQKSRIEFLTNRQYVYHKAIFDCVNEHLDRQRTFGRKGKPFPWKKTSQFKHQASDAENLQILRTCMKNVYIDASYLCGILVDKEDSLFQGRDISDNIIEQIRQDRVGRMMANQLLDQQFKWLFYDDDLAEIMLEIARDLEKQIIAEETTTMWAVMLSQK